MYIENFSYWSGNFNCEMYFNCYGYVGILVVVFVLLGGSYNEYYDFGMIDVCVFFIEEGCVQFFILFSVDSESWLVIWKNGYD